MKLKTSLALALTLGSLWTSARADITNGLVLYLPLEETSGTTVHDQSPNGFTGTITNMISDSQWQDGWITNGLNLNQNITNQLIRFPDAPALNFASSGTFTIAMWVKFLNSQLSGASFLAKGTGNGGEHYDLDWSAVGTAGRYRLVVRFATNATPAVTVAASTAAPNGVWQHVVVTCDDATNNVMRIYLNGQLNNSTAAGNLNLGHAPLITSTHELTIGNRQSASAGYNLPTTNILFDEIRLYNRVLSASDIFELFAFNGPVSHGVAPVITSQPRSITNYVGDTAPFSIGITAPAPANQIFYQWFSNGVAIPNATNATLVLPSVQLSYSAAYNVTCSNIVGMTNSAVAYLQVQPITTTNITTGLVGYWRMDDAPGSTTAADFTGSGNTGTLDSFVDYNACWVTGLTNGALYFNTNGTAIPNVLAIPSVGSPAPPSLDFSSGGTFTLSAFVNGTLPQTNGGAIFCKGTGGGGEQFAVDLNGAAANFRFYVRGTNNGVFINPVATTAVPVNGTWQHVAAVCDCVNGIMNIYVNGQLAGASVAPLTLLSNSHEISIGNRQSGATPYNLPFTGGIDEARMYNRALTSADIQALYATGGLYPPSFITQPVGGTVYVGEDYRFTDTIAGTAPFKYTWKTNGVNANAPNFLAGSTNQTLTITNLQLFNARDYTLSVTNGYGGTNSTVATLQVTNFYVTNSLAGWWKFDETTGLTASDSSGNANDGTLNNYAGDDSQWGAGRRQGALNFNYTAPPSPQHYVSIADSPTVNFDTTLKFTLSAWVKGPATQTNGSAIICKGTGGGGEQYCLDVQNGSFRFFCRTAGNTAAPGMTPTAPPTAQWQHVAVSFDGVAGFMRMYLNGVLIATNVAPNSLLVNSHEVSIGARQGAAGPYNLTFTGQIDDVRVYNRALSATDIQNLVNDAGILPPVFYAKPVGGLRFVGDNITFSGAADGTGPLTYQWFKNGGIISGATNTTLLLTNVQVTDGGGYSLLVTNTVYALGSNSTPATVLTVTPFDITNYVAYWKLDDATGSTALDSSTNGNTGTLIGLPVDDSEWVAGRLAGALNFNADGFTGEYVSIPDAPSLNFTNQLALTIAAWVRGSPSQISGAAIVAKGTGSGGEQYTLDVSGGFYRFYVRNAAGVSTPLTSPVAPNNRWQHVAATYDGTAAIMRIFVNGQQVASLAAPTSLFPNTHEVSIGSRQQGAGGYNFQFTGVIDDVRLYARALRTNEVQQIYALATNFGPLIYTQPQTATNYVHDAVTFSVVADGTDPLNYQWQKNGTPISGATSNALTFRDLALSDAATYTVVVTNPLPGSILSSNAVLTVLSLPAPDLTNELIAYWAFDETTGSATADSSGRGNSATLLEFATDDSEWVPGVLSNALHFSSSGAGATANYRVTTDNPLVFDNGNYFSFSFWAKRDGTAPTGSPRILTPQVAGQTAVVWVPGTGVGPLTPVASTEPSVNTWHNFVVTSDRVAGTYSLYVDGSKQVANAGGYVRADPTTAPQYWFIGHSETFGTSTDSFSGYLDDVRIYNRILNYNDAQALYFSAAQRLGSGQLAFAPNVSETASGSTLTLSWPRGAIGFNLYKSDSLSVPAWTSVTNVPVVSADGVAWTVTVPMNSASRYFRLQNP